MHTIEASFINHTILVVTQSTEVAESTTVLHYRQHNLTQTDACTDSYQVCSCLFLLMLVLILILFIQLVKITCIIHVHVNAIYMLIHVLVLVNNTT